jgi:hypothetical protein
MSQLKAMGLAHAETDTVVGEEFCGKHPGLGLEREASGTQSKQAGRESGKTAGSIPTHLGLATIGVIITHPGKFGRAFDGYQTISPDASVTIAKEGNLHAGKAA